MKIQKRALIDPYVIELTDNEDLTIAHKHSESAIEDIFIPHDEAVALVEWLYAEYFKNDKLILSWPESPTNTKQLELPPTKGITCTSKPFIKMPPEKVYDPKDDDRFKGKAVAAQTVPLRIGSGNPPPMHSADGGQVIHGEEVVDLTKLPGPKPF